MDLGTSTGWATAFEDPLHADLPLVVLGLSLAAILCAFATARLLGSCWTRRMTRREPPDPRETIRVLAGYARIAHADGFGFLQDHVDNIKEDFTARGIRMVIAGADPDRIKTVLEAEIEASSRRRTRVRNTLARTSTHAPWCGVGAALTAQIVMALSLDNPYAIGTGTAAALLFMSYGVVAVNGIAGVASLQPAASVPADALLKVITAGIVSIGRGDSPSTVERRMLACLPGRGADIHPSRAAA